MSQSNNDGSEMSDDCSSHEDGSARWASLHCTGLNWTARCCAASGAWWCARTGAPGGWRATTGSAGGCTNSTTPSRQKPATKHLAAFSGRYYTPLLNFILNFIWTQEKYRTFPHQSDRKSSIRRLKTGSCPSKFKLVAQQVYVFFYYCLQ